MPNVSELQIVDDLLTAVAPRLNGNTISLGVIPTCETSPVEVSEGTLTGKLLYGYMKAIELMPRVTMDVKLEKTLNLLSMLRPAPRKVLKPVAKLIFYTLQRKVAVTH